MKVGDLVVMDCNDGSDFTPAEWGSGIVLETGDRSGFVAVHWSVIGLSWETPEMLVCINATQ